ncbi:hypothetical protein P8S54_07840 [Thiomicrospira sp. R3]|uniref:hypothetical protein n=1 Tax=Thiomicrospira sp. R3 TaxID=3035472 RepID=UPI00259B4021|nr:hypothetical protein [Thiomicrospira sp. R3]WFE68128.1 hypothetical protein P8S54_07840 [Thiomicrospira sp. R3]
MKKLLVGATVATAFSMTACAHNHSTAACDDGYDSLVAEAQAKQEQSRANGNVWQQRNMKLPYVEHYLAEAEKARLESVRLAQEAVKSANGQIDQSNYGRDLTPGWYKEVR